MAAAAAVLAALPAGAAAAGCNPPGCSQTVAGTNVADDHAETHADNGGLSRDGGTIRLGASRSTSRSAQKSRSVQRIRLRGSRLSRAFIAGQQAMIVNQAKNLSAATSANTGESSQHASTTTGDAHSESTSEQSATSEQTVEIGD